MASECDFEFILKILKIVGNIQDEVISKYNDDGVSQVATVKVGIAKLDNIVIKNPVLLKPYRTFIEIDQPESLFTFRLKGGGGGKLPECALFESDGELWKIKACNNIIEYLSKYLPDIKII